MKKYVSVLLCVMMIFMLTACSPKIEGISLSDDSLEMVIGESSEIKFSVSPEDANKKNVKISSADESVAIVDKQGRVNAVSLGETSIVFSAGKEVTASCSIKVFSKVESIVLSKNSLELTEGETGEIKFSVLPKDACAGRVMIESTDTAVATVDEKGAVTACSPGEVNIVLSTESGVSAICSVTVEQKSAYDRLDDFGKTFVDNLMMNISTFRNPKSVEVIGIDTSITKEAPYIKIRAQNAVGGYASKIYVLFNGGLIPTANDDAPIYSTFSNDESIDMDLINAAIQEKLLA